MGITYTNVTIKPLPKTGKVYCADFLVDTGAIDCVVPTSELESIGVERVGQEMYELADGRQVRFDYGLVQIELMDKITAGKVVFGPDDTEPILGVVALESALLRVNPVSNELEKLPYGLLK